MKYLVSLLFVPLLFFSLLSAPVFSADEDLTQTGISALKKLADIYYFELKDYRRAEDCYRHLAELLPAEKEKGLYTYWIAMSLQAQRKYREAIEIADKGITNYPYPTDHNYYMKGFCYYRLGRYEEALLWYHKLVEEFSSSGIANNARIQTGRVLYFQNRYQESVDAFSELLYHTPDEKLTREAGQNIKDIERLFLKRK